MNIQSPMTFIISLVWLCSFASLTRAADRIVIGNVSRTVEQLPNYAATDKGFFAQEGIQGDVVLIGSTDTLIQALIAGHVNVAIVDPSAAINAVERGASLKIVGGTVPVAAYTLVTCPKYKSIKELKGTTIGTVSLVSGSTIFLREMLKAEGLELNRDYISSVQNSDVRRFDEILAEDFLCSNPDGSLVDRAGFLAQTARPVTIANLTAHDVRIRLMGDVAIIHGRTTYTLPDGRTSSGRYTDVWARRGGRWLAVSAHVTRA